MNKAAICATTQVHPVNLLGGPSLEIVLISDRQAVISGQAATGFVPLQTVPLPLPPQKGQHLYYGFARVDSTEHYSLVILSPGSVTWYPLQNGLLSSEPKVLFQTDLVSVATPGPVHRYFDMALDIDGDNIDELILAADNSFSISKREKNGTYSHVKLPRNSFKREDVYRFNRDVPEVPVRPKFFMTSLTHRRGANDMLFLMPMVTKSWT